MKKWTKEQKMKCTLKGQSLREVRMRKTIHAPLSTSSLWSIASKQHAVSISLSQSCTRRCLINWGTRSSMGTMLPANRETLGVSWVWLLWCSRLSMTLEIVSRESISFCKSSLWISKRIPIFARDSWRRNVLASVTKGRSGIFWRDNSNSFAYSLSQVTISGTNFLKRQTSMRSTVPSIKF